jgi:hypothetical protein
MGRVSLIRPYSCVCICGGGGGGWWRWGLGKACIDTIQCTHACTHAYTHTHTNTNRISQPTHAHTQTQTRTHRLDVPGEVDEALDGLHVSRLQLQVLLQVVVCRHAMCWGCGVRGCEWGVGSTVQWFPAGRSWL